ncbi:aminodeoxychorismate synthase component I [Patescibacteria group bacterium]
MNLPKIKSVRVKVLPNDLDPTAVFNNYADRSYNALLTGSAQKDNSRYSFIGINPLLIWDSKDDPFEELQRLLNHFSVKKYKYPVNLWGGIGYISYEAAHHIEKLPKTTKDPLNMPVMQVVFYKDMIVFDHHENKNYLIQIQTSDQDFTELHITNNKEQRNFKTRRPALCCSSEKYIKQIKIIKKYIKDGDVYEVNLSHQCHIPFEGDPYSIFQKLYNINSAPFSAYLSFAEHKIISNSPERFILAEGNKLETRPMKGTAPRGKNPNEDKKNKKELSESVKDDAELSMIVDLMRNDFGKVCEYGSVKVREHKRIEPYQNVWQMISIVEGKLRPEENYGSLLRACFPGGSITGCPKIRSMEIIDELEDYSRNLYTGTIFIANDQRFDSNIVIRSIIAHKDMLNFNIGGAIVYDSDPQKEYEETMHKAKSIMEALDLTKPTY